MTEAKARLISRTLYRSLLRASKPFTDNSSEGALLCSLLYRTGDDDPSDATDPIPPTKEDMSDNKQDGKLLYKSLVAEIIGHGKHMNFPSTIMASMNSHNNIMNRIRSVIKMEFRDNPTEDRDGRTLLSNTFSFVERRNAAFMGLRQLNKKLQYAKTIGILSSTNKYKDGLNLKLDIPTPLQVTSQIQPGTYLIAHPLLGGYFAKSVVVILEHSTEESGGGAYGLVINRPSFIHDTFNLSTNSTFKRRRNLSETIRSDTLPLLVKKAFGQCPILEGGPLNLSIQMLKRDSRQENDYKPDGNVIEFGGKEKVYFGGDIIKASQEVVDHNIHLDDIVFIVGASCWETGQLEREIKQGYWLLCEGPPLFDELRFAMKNDDALNETWISFTKAVSEEDARLAMAMINDSDDEEEDGLACDSF